MAILVVWAVMLGYRILIQVPQNMEAARLRGVLDYDGIGGNLAILLFGWIGAIIICALALLACNVVNKVRYRSPRLANPAEEEKPNDAASPP